MDLKEHPQTHPNPAPTPTTRSTRLIAPPPPLVFHPVLALALGRLSPLGLAATEGLPPAACAAALAAAARLPLLAARAGLGAAAAAAYIY